MNTTIQTAPAVTVIPATERPALVAESGGAVLRVAAYCRVSTGEEEQLNSYTTQVKYYTDYINANPNWMLVGIFADEGISGTQTEKRTEFNKMIKLCRRHKIDLILCKSISRFARNTVDCLEFVRELKALNVNVKFEKENIETLTAMIRRNTICVTAMLRSSTAIHGTGCIWSLHGGAPKRRAGIQAGDL